MPRIDSGNRTTSRAVIGFSPLVAVPMKTPSLIWSRLDFTTQANLAPPTSTVSVAPSRVLIVTVEPSAFSIVPRMRSSAWAEKAAPDRVIRPATARVVKVFMDLSG